MYVVAKVYDYIVIYHYIYISFDIRVTINSCELSLKITLNYIPVSNKSIFQSAITINRATKCFNIG